jgi:hypothetical protein
MQNDMKKFSRLRQPKPCRVCGKLTTGPVGIIGIDLCVPCYDAAGIENEHYDGYHTHTPHPDCPLCMNSVKPTTNPA